MIQTMKNPNLLQKVWYVIDSETAKDKNNPNNSIKFKTESITLNLCDYSDIFILVTEDLTVNTGDDDGNNADVAFKNCVQFYACKTKINDVFMMKQIILHCNAYAQFDRI